MRRSTTRCSRHTPNTSVDGGAKGIAILRASSDGTEREQRRSKRRVAQCPPQKLGFQASSASDCSQRTHERNDDSHDERTVEQQANGRDQYSDSEQSSGPTITKSHLMAEPTALNHHRHSLNRKENCRTAIPTMSRDGYDEIVDRAAE